MCTAIYFLVRLILLSVGLPPGLSISSQLLTYFYMPLTQINTGKSMLWLANGTSLEVKK